MNRIKIIKDTSIINNELIVLKIDHIDTKNDLEDMLRCGFEFCNNNNLKNLLYIGCNQCDNIMKEPFDQFHLGELIEEIFRLSNIQIAVLSTCNHFSHFTETVALNRGISFMSSDNPQKIEKWFNLDFKIFDTNTKDFSLATS